MREHYQMSFVLKMFLIYFVCAFLIAIPHGFAFYHTSLQISCVLLASKFYGNANFKITSINAKVFNACNAFKNATSFLSKITLCNYNMMSFSGCPVFRLGLNWCILLGLFFPALAKGSCCLLSSLGGKASFIMYSNTKFLLHLYQIIQNVCPNDLICTKLIHYLGYLGDIICYFHVLLTECTIS